MVRKIKFRTIYRERGAMTTGWTKTISHEQLTAKGSAVVRRGGK